MRLWPRKHPAPPTIDEIREAAAAAAEKAVERAIMSGPELFGALGVKDSPKSYPYRLDFPHQFWMTTSPRRLPGKQYAIETLRAWARYFDPLRSIIEYLKAELGSIPVSFSARENVDKDVTDQINAMKDWVGDTGPLGGAATRRVFEAKLFEDLLVCGAYAVWYEHNRRGGLLSCDVIDVATVKPRITSHGWADPDVPFEQWVIGAQVASFRPGEIRYDGIFPRVDTPYFDSAIEFAVSRITAGLNVDDWNLSWLSGTASDTGNVYTLPGDWTVDQVMAFSDWWQIQANRQGTKFLPGDSKKISDFSRKDQDFQEFEMQVIRRLCALFGVQPASIGYVGEQYKVTQGDSMDHSRRVGLGRLMAVRKEFYDDLCRRLGFVDLESVNVDDDLDEREQLGRVHQAECGKPWKTRNEVRQEQGLAPIPEWDEQDVQGAEQDPEGGPEDDGLPFDQRVERAGDPNQPRGPHGRWIKTIEVPPAQFRDLSSKSDRRHSARMVLLPLQGAVITTPGNRQIVVTGRTISHILSGDLTPGACDAIANLRAVIENSTLVNSKRDRRSRPEVHKVYRLATRLHTSAGVSVAYATVFEYVQVDPNTGQKHRLYHLDELK